MGTIARAFASSHAFALMEPATWDERRHMNQQMFGRRYGNVAPDQPGVAAETDTIVADRYANIRGALAALRDKLAAERPDVLIVVGDDQNENFTEFNLPQFAIYVGDEFDSGAANDAAPEHRRSHRALAEAILTGCVEADIDMACIRKFPNNRLFGHAFYPVLRTVDPDNRLAVIPVFVNAIHMPAPSPARCFYLGRTIGNIVEGFADIGRVAIYASGGLSHYTGGYPWKHYRGPMTHGSIDVDYDRRLLETMKTGKNSSLAELTTADLLAHGEIELRSWIVTLGALGDAKPDVLAYEPFYRGLMGMGVASWLGTGSRVGR